MSQIELTCRRFPWVARMVSNVSQRWRESLPRVYRTVILVAVGLTLARLFLIPAPIYSGDEYAYWRHALNLAYQGEELIEVLRRDPALQWVNNLLYQWVLYRVADLSHASLAAVGFLQWLIWLGVLAAIHVCARHEIKGPAGYIPLLVAAFMPFSTYVGALMPEILLGAGFWLCSLWLLRLSRPGWPLWVASLLVGALCGLLMLVKVHALAFALAALLTLMAQPFLGAVRSSPRVAAARALLLGALFLAAFWLTRRTLLSAFAGHPLIASDGGLFGRLYADIFTQEIGPGRLFHDLIMYLALHLNLLAIFFAAGLLLSAMIIVEPVRAILRTARARMDEPPHAGVMQTSPVLLFWSISLVVHLLMVAVFSTFAGLTQAFEYGRLHERYYWYLLPALVILTLVGGARWGPLQRGGAAALTLVAVLVFLFHTQGSFSLYPWDAPDLFALYRFNPQWGYALPWPGLYFLVLGGVLCYAILLWGSARWAPAGFAAQMLLLSAVSFAGILPWQAETSARAAELFAQGRAISQLAAGHAEVTVVADQRYGPTAYLMMGLQRPPYFIWQAGATLEAGQVPPGTGVLVLADGNRFEGERLNALRIGELEVLILPRPAP